MGKMRQACEEMVEFQIRRRGISDERVLEAVRAIPRHKFVDKSQQLFSYEDGPLPIGHGQTISQPYIVAFMTEILHLEDHHIVLEIGTGCGYQTAILASLVARVVSLDIIQDLVDSARNRLKELEITNVELMTADGHRGWPELAPYDRIMVTAAPKRVPPALVDQLALNGRMVIPAGRNVNSQYLEIVTKDSHGKIHTETSLPVRFVPLVKRSPASG